jgi:hypothetical protein
LQKRMDTLKTDIQEQTTTVSAKEKELTEMVPVPTEDIAEKISGASKHNQRHADLTAHKKNEVDLISAKDHYQGLGFKRDALLDEKIKLISAAKLPIDGLTFTDEGLLINGVPLASDQQSTSELMVMAAKLAAAKMKQQRVHILRVDRAESLGTDRLALINELARVEDFQVFYEEVQRGQEILKVEYID